MLCGMDWFWTDPSDDDGYVDLQRADYDEANWIYIPSVIGDYWAANGSWMVKSKDLHRCRVLNSVYTVHLKI